MPITKASFYLFAYLIASVVHAAPAFYSEEISTLSSCSPTCANPGPNCSGSIDCKGACGCEPGLLLDQRQDRCVSFWQCSMPDIIHEHGS